MNHEEIETEIVTIAKEDNASRRPWNRPVITRIEMKRTMLSVGSGTDYTTLHN